MKKLTKLALLTFLAVSALAIPGNTNAATLIPPNAWPNDEWSVRKYGESVVGTSTLQGHTWLGITRDSSATGSAQVIYNAGSVKDGVPVLSEGNQLGNLKGSVIVGSSKWGDSLGVVLRAEGSAFSSAAASKNAYYLAMTTTGLGLYWNVGDSFLGVATLLTQSSYSSALGALTSTLNNQYLIEFSAVGLQFDASVWVLDGSGNKSGAALATISYLDAREEARLSGYFGIRGGRYGGERTSYFRDVKVEAIPEPSMGMLLLVAIGGGAIGHRIFRSKKG